MKLTLAKAEQRHLENKAFYPVKLALVQATYFLSGILVSCGTVLGNYFPFGISMAASVPEKNILASIIGIIIGYLFVPQTGSSIRYISTIIAIAAVRWTLNDLDKVKRHPIYAPAIAFVPTLITGFAISSVDSFDGSSIMMNFIEACLAAGTSYFMYKTYYSFTMKKVNSLDLQDFACLCITTCILILSLSSLTIGFISIGRIMAVLMILIGAACAGVSGGGITGIVSGVIFSLPSFGLTYISGSYGFGGMIAGLFAPFGKIGVCVAFLLSNALVSFQSGSITKMISSFYEILIAMAVFAFIPNRILNRIQRVIPSSTGRDESRAVYGFVNQRLNTASKAIMDIPICVEAVAQKLEKIDVPDLKNVCMNSVYSVCNKCGLRVFCWEKDYDETKQEFSRITSSLADGQAINDDVLSEKFRKRCCRLPELTADINKRYNEFNYSKNVSKRTSELRGVVEEQFNGVGKLLKDIANDFDSCDMFDGEMALRIEDKLQGLGIITSNVICRINKSKRMLIEIEAIELDEDIYNKNIICKSLEIVCNRKFDTPVIDKIGERVKIRLSEKTLFTFDIGISQHVCNNGKLCGDNYDYFKDGLGNLMVMISDGMGTGGNAAVDGAMAAGLMSNLVKSGISFNCAIKIVNSALMVKSGDESLATLDILSLNLFSGEVNFMKAGAPLTIVKHRGRVETIDSASLPIGILGDAELLCDKLKMEEDDWVLMVSDGAIIDGEDWLQKELRNWTKDSADNLSKHIVKEAEKRCDGHDDDITAIAIKIKKRV